MPVLYEQGAASSAHLTPAVPRVQDDGENAGGFKNRGSSGHVSKNKGGQKQKKKEKREISGRKFVKIEIYHKNNPEMRYDY